jgi:hypothetical protein
LDTVDTETPAAAAMLVSERAVVRTPEAGSRSTVGWVGFLGTLRLPAALSAHQSFRKDISQKPL